MTPDSFVWSVLASITAAIVLLIAGTLLSRRLRWLLTGVLGRLLRVEIDYVFASSRDAQDDLAAAISRAHDVRILVGRGHELQRPTFLSLFADRPAHGGPNVRILLPASAPRASTVDWTAQRETELQAFDPAFGRGLLRQQIEGTASFLAGYPAPGVEVRYFEAPHLGRLIITGEEAYLSLYEARRHGRDSRVHKIRRGDLYNGLARYFDLLWAGSTGTEDAIVSNRQVAGVAESQSARSS